MTEVADKTDEDFIIDTKPTINKEYYYKKEDNRWYKSIYKTLKKDYDGVLGRDETITIIMENDDKPKALYVLKSEIPPLEYELSDKLIPIVLDKTKYYYYEYGVNDQYARPIIHKGNIVQVINTYPRLEFMMSDNKRVEKLYYEPPGEFNAALSGGGGAKRNKKSRKQKRRVRKSRRNRRR